MQESLMVGDAAASRKGPASETETTTPAATEAPAEASQA
jgi:hypothetical protein